MDFIFKNVSAETPRFPLILPVHVLCKEQEHTKHASYLSLPADAGRRNRE